MMRVAVVIFVLTFSAVALAQSRGGAARRDAPQERTPASAAPSAKEEIAPAGREPITRGGAAKTASEPRDRVVYKKRTVIDLTGTLIEGDLIKPEGAYVVSRKASRFSTLIRVRENFLPELLASSNDLSH